MKRIYLITVLVAAAFVLQSCDKNDLLTPSGNNEVESAFVMMYNDVTRAEWEKKGEYWTVDFRKNNKEMEAWFNQAGEWFLTETDIRFDELPEAIKTAFRASEYKDWRIDDVDMIERKEMETSYVLEIEQGKQDCDLYYSPDGTLVKVVADGSTDNNNNEHYLPSSLSETIKTYISTKYPQARIVEMETERGMMEVDIVDGTIHRELLFNESGEWYQTETSLRFNMLPEAVKAAFQSGEYQGWRVDDVEMFERKDTGTFYVFEAEKGKREYKLHYSPEGVLIKAVAD